MSEAAMTHYDILEVPNDASQDEIKRAFQAKIRAEHPDKSTNDNRQELATLIISAYKILSDPTLRADYDAELAVRQEKAFKGQCFDEIRASKADETIDYECEQCGEINTVSLSSVDKKRQS